MNEEKEKVEVGKIYGCQKVLSRNLSPNHRKSGNRQFIVECITCGSINENYVLRKNKKGVYPEQCPNCFEFFAKNLIGDITNDKKVLGIIKKGKRQRTHLHLQCNKCGKETFPLYEKKNKHPCGCSTIIDIRTLATNKLWANYKYDAERRGYPFSLDFDTFVEYLESCCFYCLVPWSNTKKRIIPKNNNKISEFYMKANNLTLEEFTEYRYNGIDRVHNHLGYTVGNTVPCCDRCNKAKRDMGLEEFLAWMEDVGGIENVRRIKKEFMKRGIPIKLIPTDSNILKKEAA